jgi:hypothetical protein
VTALSRQALQLLANPGLLRGKAQRKGVKLGSKGRLLMKSTENFRLQRGGAKRLGITSGAGGTTVEIALDGALVSTISFDSAKSGPVQVDTAEGVLLVQLKPGYSLSNWALTLNGRPVPGAQNDPVAKVYFGAGAGLIVGLMDCVVGLGEGSPLTLGIGLALIAAAAAALKRSWLAAWLCTGLSGAGWVAAMATLLPKLAIKALAPGVLVVFIVHSAVSGIDELRRIEIVPSGQ